MVRLHSEIDVRPRANSAESRLFSQLEGVKATDVTGKNKVAAFFKRFFTGTWFGGVKETIKDTKGVEKTYYVNKKSLIKFLNNNTSENYTKKNQIKCT